MRPTTAVAPLRSTPVGAPAIHTGVQRAYSLMRAVAWAHGDADREGRDIGLER
jgi:hypothetical protein